MQYDSSDKIRIKSPEQAKLELQQRGVSISQWARQNGFQRQLVHAVLGGRKCIRGESHRIAIALGIKEQPGA